MSEAQASAPRHAGGRAGASPALASHFHDLRQQHAAADLGLWIFLATEILFFGGLFAAYLVYALLYPAEFLEAAAKTEIVIGTINTALLLTSGLSAALAVKAAGEDMRRSVMVLIAVTIGLGVAGGVVTISVFQKRIPKEWAFVGAVFVAGASLLVAASMSALELAAAFVFVLGICAGTVYVLGFTMLHEHVEDELRGRIFSALYTLVRLCVLISFAVGPFLSELFGGLSDAVFEDNHITLFGASIAVPGVVLTLWTAGLIILVAGFIAASSMRDAARKELVVMPKAGNSNSNSNGDGGDAADGE